MGLRRVLRGRRQVEVSAPRVELPPGALDCVVAHNQFGAYCVPRSAHHRPAAQAVLQAEVWERETLDFLTGIPGNLLHAGTFFGDFLPALARSRSDAHVWAFEPNQENFRCAQVTVALNDLRNVLLAHGALDASAGEGRLRTTDGDGRALGGKSHLAGDGEPVPLIAIDDVLDTAPVAAIQLDVEGNEQAALEGAIKTIREQRPILVLETPPEEWIARELEPLGYREGEPVGPNRVFRV